MSTLLKVLLLILSIISNLWALPTDTSNNSTDGKIVFLNDGKQQQITTEITPANRISPDSAGYVQRPSNYYHEVDTPSISNSAPSDSFNEAPSSAGVSDISPQYSNPGGASYQTSGHQQPQQSNFSPIPTSAGPSYTIVQPGSGHGSSYQKPVNSSPVYPPNNKGDNPNNEHETDSEPHYALVQTIMPSGNINKPSGSSSYQKPSNQPISESGYQFEKPIGNNNNYPSTAAGQEIPSSFNNRPDGNTNNSNNYGLGSSSMNQGFENPSDTSHLSNNNPSSSVETCSCVANSHCPLLGTRIVTPDIPCPRTGDVRCCFQHGTMPSPKCGKRPNITLEGIALRPGQAPFAYHPWSAVLLTPNNEFVSGGVLLDEFHVLTAAHKVTAFVGNLRGLKVRLGEWDAEANHEPYGFVESDVEDVHVFPEFSSKNLKGDVAVLRLVNRIDFNEQPHISPACLPSQDALFNGQRCWVAGWGKDAFGSKGSFQRIIKEVDVPIVSAEECELRLRDTKLTQHFQLDRRSFICAGGEPQKDACTGDGGSPLVCEDPQNEQFYAVGLVAWGIGCATSNIPGVYVNVAGYSNWISENLLAFKRSKI